MKRPACQRAHSTRPRSACRTFGPARRAGLAITPLLLLLAAIASAQSGDAPLTLEADELEFRGAESVYIARGNVRIQQKGRELRADSVYLNDETQLGAASGSVEIREGGDILQSEFLQFDTGSLQGVAFSGELLGKEAEYTLTGSEIRKTGAKTYEVEDGRFTTCKCPDSQARDPWAIRAASTEAELGGYAVAKNTKFDVLGVPLIWVPWFFYPLKEERTTGFLGPTFGRSSRSGWEAAVPFFWAARHNINVTATPQYLSKRGFKPSLETEYVFGERSGGQLYGMYIHDNDIDHSEVKEDFSRDRWGIRGEHLQDLPGNLHFQFAGAGISDNRVTFDFDDFYDYRLDRWLFSNGFLWTHQGPSDRFALLAGARIADDLQNPDVEDRDEFMLQRLPEVQFNAMTGTVPGVPGLVATADLEFINFESYLDADRRFSDNLLVDDLFYDTGIDSIPTGKERDSAGTRVPFDIHRDDGVTEVNGLFEEGEPIADGGQRITVQPRISYPLHLWDAVHVVPEVGYYGTFYWSDALGTDVRNLLIARGSVRTRLEREIPWFFRSDSADHVIEPFLGYAVVSDASQDDNPLFVPRTTVPQKRLRHIEPSNLLLDPADRIGEVSSAFVGFENRFLHPKRGTPLAEVSTSTEYRFANGKWGPSVLMGTVDPSSGVNVRFHAVYEQTETKVTDGLFQFSWNHADGHVVTLRYRYLREIPRVFEAFSFDDDRFKDFDDQFDRINQVGGLIYLRFNPQWSVSYLGSYSFENSLSLRNLAGIEYLSRCKCWAIRGEVAQDPQRGYEFQFQYRLLGVGDNLDYPFSNPSQNPFARN